MSDALIVIDMQNDFCMPGGPLFVAGAPGVVGNVAEVCRSARDAGIPVIFVLRRHRAEGCDVDRSRTELFADNGFLAQSPGVDLVEGLAVEPGDIVVEKRRWSAFFATDLDLVLRRLSVTHVWLSGVQTPNCIRATAYDATALDYECTVLADATASATSAVQEANLSDMANAGIGVATTLEFKDSTDLTAATTRPESTAHARP